MISRLFSRLTQPWSDGLLLAALIVAGTAFAGEPPRVRLDSTADHAKYKELQQSFATGPELTKVCLSCHTEAARQVHRTKHWTWDFLNPENQQRQGKKNVINNFCISVPSNYAFCTSCHVGYGWKDASFDFASEENVDCLACHKRQHHQQVTQLPRPQNLSNIFHLCLFTCLSLSNLLFPSQHPPCQVAYVGETLGLQKALGHTTARARTAMNYDFVVFVLL
jgi:hypothetical protein